MIILVNILAILKKIGLLDYESRVVINKEGRVANQHKIKWMTNKIDDLPRIIENEVMDTKRWSLYNKMTGKKRS